MTIPRRDWRGAEGLGARVIAHDVFGWRVHQHILPAGCALVVVAARSVDRAAAPNRAIYVRGRGVVTNSLGGQFEDRLPGLYTGERPDHPSGITKVTAAEELEFWCFNWHANRGALPELAPLRATNAELVELEAGQRILVCSGSLGEHGIGPFVAEGGRLMAVGDVYGFLIGGDRG